MNRQFIVGMRCGTVIAWLFLEQPHPQAAAVDAKRKPKAQAESFVIAPVIRLDASSEMRVNVAYQNRSKTPFRYMLAHEGAGGNAPPIAGMYCHLRRKGRPIAPRDEGAPPVYSVKNVREIRPGDMLMQTISLKGKFGVLEAGMYELRAYYNVPENSATHKDFGMTPLVRNETIAFVEIR